MMIGHATAVYYMYVHARWIRRFVNLKSHENLVFRFLEPNRRNESEKELTFAPQDSCTLVL